MMQELTEQDFALFKTEAQKWIDSFGLKDWEIYFSFERLENSKAECVVNWTGKACMLKLGKFPRFDMSQEDVKRAAFHEVCELLLTDMEFTALNDDILLETRKSMTEVARHAVIRRLENYMFGGR